MFKSYHPEYFFYLLLKNAFFSFICFVFLFLLELFLVLCLFFTFMVVYAANAVYAILFLIGVFLLNGVIFIILGAEYLGLVFMIIYVGAIAILFIFILMLLDLRNLMKQRVPLWQMGLFMTIVFTITEYMLFIVPLGPIKFFLTSTMLPFLVGTKNTIFLNDSLLVVSTSLYNVYFPYVLGCGAILLFVMIGVVLLLAEWVFPFHEKRSNQNKYLTDFKKTIYVSRKSISHGL